MMHLLRSARGEPRNWYPFILQQFAPRLSVVHSYNVGGYRDPMRVTVHLLFVFCYTKDSLRGFLAEREIIAMLFSWSGFLPEPFAKINSFSETSKYLPVFLAKQ